MKRLVKLALRGTPYRVIRARNANRFQGIEEMLLSLRARKYAPRMVIDGGANVGDFTRMVRRVYGAAPFVHLFEPQPACQAQLSQLASQDNRISVHGSALSSRHGETLELAVDPAEVTTGAYVVANDAIKHAVDHKVAVPTATLDATLSEFVQRSDRALLKLDLQGWEMEALMGGREVIPDFELALVEVSLFAQAYEPSIRRVIEFFDDAGLDLHDIGSISARARDNRARQADFLFCSRWSPLSQDGAWG